MSGFVTRLTIELRIGEEESIEDAISELPSYSREGFEEDDDGLWRGDFVVTCPVAPELAEGDLEDELVPFIALLLRMKTLYGASFCNWKLRLESRIRIRLAWRAIVSPFWRRSGLRFV